MHADMQRFRIILFAAGAADDLLANALGSIQRLGIEAQDVVVARYRSDFHRASEVVPAGAWLIELDELSDAERNTDAFVNYGTPEFSDLIELRFQIVRQQLSQGNHVIYADLDVAWLRSPLAYLAQVLERYDCAFQTEPLPLFPPMFCTGFFAMRPSRRSIDLVDAHYALFREQRKSNPAATMQDLLVRLMQEEPRFLRSCFPLPESLFPTGRLYRQFDEAGKFEGILGETEPFIFHANWVIGHEDKIRLLQRVGAWQPDG